MNLEEEVICGYKVSEKRKRVWAVQIELAKKMDEICKKHAIKYFASDGTLLGCIRHNGFIPWDDDMDFVMLRDDYEKFLSVAPAELPEYYFLQDYYTEKNYFSGHAQLRDSRTTCLLKGGHAALANKKNCGIFIDIFPIDYLADTLKKRKKQARKVWFYRLCCCRKIDKNSVNASFMVRTLSTLYNACHGLDGTVRKALDPCRGKRPTGTLGVITFAPGNESCVWNASAFTGGGYYHKFNDIELFIPADFDGVLKKEYGDYMTIPEYKGGSMHTCFFDPYKPYTDYVGIGKDEYDKLFEEFVL